MKSINDISLEFKNCDTDQLDFFIGTYSKDSRKGVITLVNKAEKLKTEYKKELQRIEKMSVYENTFYNAGKTCIAGLDEVGRGPLAGPVVTSAVILPKNAIILNINDSKKLPEPKRSLIYDYITKIAIDIQVSIIDNNIIDEINILQATIKSMENSINSLKQKPDQLIIDSIALDNINISQLSINKADEKSISVAAASIIAKVTRDRLMQEYHKIYPQYEFYKNKGYGTKQHIEALKKYGPCPIHRKSFIKNMV